MLRRETVREMWEGYARRVLPADAGEVQRIETRRAFYAGFFSLLSALRAFDDSVSEDEDAERLAAWQAEVDAFYALVKAGKL